MANCADTEEEAPGSFLGGRLRLVQGRGGHRVGTDAALLAAAAGANAGDLVADFGAGVGAVGLGVAARAPGARLLLAELDEGAARLAERNVALNGLGDRARVVRVDLMRPGREREAAGLPREAADLVLTNPPYLTAGRHRPSPDPGRRRAHEMGEGGLDAWVRACASTLRPGGTLALIHRADALARVLAALEARFGAVLLMAVHPREGADAHRMLVRAVKGSRAPLRMRPPLVLHEADGRLAPPAAALHRGEALIDWGRQGARP